MAPKRSSNIDWYSVFLDAFSPDGAVEGSSGNSPAPAPPQAPATTRPPRNEFERRFGVGGARVDDDGGPYFTRAAPANKAAVGLGLDLNVPPASSNGVFDFMDEDEQGGHVSREESSSPKFSEQKKNDGQQAAVGMGLDLPSASKGVSDFSPMDEDEPREHLSLEQRSKSSPKFSGQKKNDDQLPLNKKKSQGRGGKRKPSVNKRRAHAIDPEDSDEVHFPVDSLIRDGGSTIMHHLEVPIISSNPASYPSCRMNQRLHNSSSVHSRKVQDVVLLDDDEDMEPKEEVNHREMFDRLSEQKIFYPSRDDQEAVDLTRSDVKCLDPEVFLSSPVINFYIKYIQRTRLCDENFRDKFYIFNTYFFGKLEKALYQQRDFPKLRRWWKGVNIFNNAYIILPIHMQEHWSLVIICLPPKERISEPTILHLDSLGMHRSAKILNIVERFIENEWHFLSVAEAAWPCLQSDIRKETVQVPQQDNSYDCGIFMLYYIEQFIKEAPARFTTDKLAMFGHSWFQPEEASGLRQRIRELLLEQFESAARMNDAIPKENASKVFDNIKKDWKLEADDSSKMVTQIGVGLGNAVESNEGINAAESEEAIEMFRDDAANIVEGISIVEPKKEEASGEFRDIGRTNEGIKVTKSGYPDKSMEDIADVAVLNKGPTSSSNKCNEKNNTDATMDDAISKADECEGYDSKKSEEAIEVSRDAAKSVEGISAAEPDEASGASRDIGKINKVIKVLASGEARMESRYLDKSMGDVADVAVLNKGLTTSSNKRDEKNNAGCVVSEAVSCSDSIINDNKSTVKTDSGSSKAEKEGKSIGTASPERLKVTEEVTDGTPIPDAVSDDIGVKRSEGNEEATPTGSMPFPDTVWETSGAKLWITGIRKRTSGTTLEPGSWSWSSGGSSRNARRKLIEHFLGNSSKN